MKLNLKWSFNNRKVTKLDAVSFGLPAFKSRNRFKVCPKAGYCASLCYARQGFYIMDTVANAREFNLEQVKLKSFVQFANEDLTKIKQHIIRIHDSGDFFNQDYLNMWISIAEKNPKKRFYAYTKSHHLDFSSIPKNFSIIHSEGSICDDLIPENGKRARIFENESDLKYAGYSNGSKTDYLAIYGKPGTKIGLIYHGTRKLKNQLKEAA